MAEIVGLVASSIALAQVVGKIGGGVLKLKRMWDEVKDVPEAIQDLFKRLELILPMVARIARDIETGATLFEDMEAVESCILSCQQVISDEATMMNDLIVQIDATKRARRVRDFVRVALKRDVLERHEKKLEVMIQILLPVHSEYSRFVGYPNLRRWVQVADVRSGPAPRLSRRPLSSICQPRDM